MISEVEILGKIADIVEHNSEKIFNSILRRIKDFSEKSKIELRTAFTKYLEESFKKHSMIKTILYKNQPKYLYDFFECNDLKLDGDIIDCSNVNNILAISNFNLIVGNGGMGKSTLMKHFFINSLQTCELIPLFIELRNFNDNDNLLDYCYSIISDLGFKSDKKYFKYALETGTFMLVLDGFDEISDCYKNHFRKQLFSFVDKFSSNYYLISSRPCEQFIGWTRFTKFDTVPFSKDKAIKLISHINYDKSIKEKFLLKLEESLYDKHKSFASNPLLLNIMLLTFDNYAEIPEKLHIFYYQAFDTLYSIHDATKPDGFKRDLKSKLPYDDFKMVFSCFCFRSYIKSKVEFTKEEILEFLDEAGKGVQNFVKEDYLEDLKSAVCLICLDGLNYCFIHRSFQEYFTAVYLKNLDDDLQKIVCRNIIDKMSSSFVHDSVFSMLKDMSNERFEKNVVLPYLSNIEEKLPKYENRIKNFYFYFIHHIEIINIGKNIDDLEFDWLSRDRNVAILIVFNSEINSHFLFFLYTKYCIDKQSTLNLEKLFLKHLNTKITNEMLIKDSALYSKIITETSVGYMIRTISNLYTVLSEKQKNTFSEIEALFN